MPHFDTLDYKPQISAFNEHSETNTDKSLISLLKYAVQAIPLLDE